MPREEDLETAIQNMIVDIRALNLNPRIFEEMVERNGAVEACKRLVTSGDYQPGFRSLVARNRSELTVESIMLLEDWEGLFSDSHLAAADFRLRDAGGVVPPRTW